MKKMPVLQMRTRILALCLSCTLLALFLQTLFFQYSASSIISQQERDASRSSLLRMQDELYGWIKSYENNLIKIYNQAAFSRELGSQLAGNDPPAGNSRAAYTMALTAFDPSQGVNALYIYGMDNRLLSYYRSASTPRYKYPEDIYADPVSSNARVVSEYAHSDDRVMLVSSYHNTSRDRDVIRFVLKIYTNNVTRKIGYIVCDVDTNSFMRIIGKYVYSERQIVWLQPRGDRPALRYGRLEGRQKEYFDVVSTRILENGWSEHDGRTIRDSVFLEIPQQKYNLTSYSLTPQYLLEESQKVLTRNMLIIALIVVTVAVISAILITRSLSTPLTRIVRSLKEIKSGRMDLRLSGLRSDEIGTLGRAINEMLDQIQELMGQQYNAKLLLKQAEYKALQAQVNPHFLYNTLETMSSVAAAQKCHTVSTLCQAMSNIFRYSMDMQDPLSTVGNEIVHLKNYMYVMNVRTQNGIELEIDIDQDLLGEKVPRLSLQPLVENAISHGLVNKRGAKRIVIEGAAQNGDMVLSITDNGVGMDAERINRGLREEDAAAFGRSTSIGLANINARIRLLFGEAYGISVRSRLQEGSTVTLRVPRMGKEAAQS
ncbi:MAG: histidine kinase [Spirochaetia bacterium]|jgi:sensor histidine kinase YesM